MKRILTILGGFAMVAVVCIAIVHAEPEAVVTGSRGYSNSPTDVQALESYKLVALRRVHFSAGKHDLSLSENTSLENVATRFGQTNQWVVEIRGFADGAGSTEQDAALSIERAQAVARIFSAHGIPTQSILLLGLGEIDPTVPALNPEHQRVDIRIFRRPANDTSSSSTVSSLATNHKN